MRLSPLAPADLDPERRSMHDDMSKAIAEHLQGFVSRRDDGALVGPFPPMLHFPDWGKPAWDYTKALMDHSSLPKPAHEVAILVTGASLGSRYELYAYEQVGQNAGLSPDKVATIAAGQRPADLDEQEAAAYDVASVLAGGRQLPESTYRRALAVFGRQQVGELVFLIGGYCLVSVLLNAFDMSVPGSEEGLPHG